MIAREIFNEFLNHCVEYEIEYNNIVITNNENTFIVSEPDDRQKTTYILYTIIRNNGREQGYANDVEELIEVAIDAVGCDKIKNDFKQGRGNLYSI